MKKLLLILVSVFTFILAPTTVSAQGMMGNWTGSPSSSIDQTTIQSQQKEEQEGKKLLGQLKNKTTNCQKLTDDNFEKIGEYFMGQAIGNTSQHISMNNMMANMMGQQGEEQMHIAWGKKGSGCEPDAQLSQKGIGFMPMMWMMGWGYGNMMGSYGFGVIANLFWFVVLVDLILLGIWLWKQIQKK